MNRKKDEAMSTGKCANELDVEEMGRATLPGSRSYHVGSKHIDQTYLIEVARPAQPLAEGRMLPVIYVLDGNGVFAATVQILRMLQSGPGALPPSLVVGIGYRFEKSRASGAQHHEFRTRDFTPTPDRAWIEMSRAAIAAQGAEVDARSGGAVSFLAFIDGELKPFIASRYVVDDADQTLIGMSLGGFFTLYTLFTSAASFQRYIAISPSLWWDNRLLFREEAALAARVRDLPVRLFLGVGALEETDGAPYFPVSNLAEMHATLERRRYPRLQMTHHEFPDETHMSVYAAAVSRGLRAVFA